MPEYSTEALERGIESCKKNIKTFEEAIDKERATIKEYRGMIDKIEEKERLSKVVELEVDNGNQDGRIHRLG